MPQARGRGGRGAEPAVTREMAAEAAVWIARLHGPQRSKVLERECLAWQALSPAHRLAFERCTDLWMDVAGVDRAAVARACAAAVPEGDVAAASSSICWEKKPMIVPSCLATNTVLCWPRNAPCQRLVISAVPTGGGGRRAHTRAGAAIDSFRSSRNARRSDSVALRHSMPTGSVCRTRPSLPAGLARSPELRHGLLPDKPKPAQSCRHSNYSKSPNERVWPIRRASFASPARGVLRSPA